MNRHQRRKGAKLGIKEIVGDDNLREQRCLQEVDQVLSKFDCVILPKMILSHGNVQAIIEITAKPRKKLDA